MWMFCKSGFFSAVQHNANPGLIHLRARLKGDLERLFEKHGYVVEITHTPNNDYAWRADVTKEAWAAICKAEAEDVDYTNFKNRVHDGTARDAAYMNVWADMAEAQDRQTGRNG